MLKFLLAAVALTLVTNSAQRVERASRDVTLDVAVTTSRGAAVSGLPLESFDLLVDGATARVDTVAAGPAPLALVLVVQATESMWEPLGKIRPAVTKRFIPSIHAADRVRFGRIGRIGHAVVFSPVIAGGPKDLERAFRATMTMQLGDPRGAAPIWDATVEAIDLLTPEAGRRAVVLLTDGRGTGNRFGAADVQHRAAAAGVIVAIVSADRALAIPQSGDRVLATRPELPLRALAAHSGGLFLWDDPIPTAYDDVVRDLREMYTLRFTSPHTDGKMHKVEVRVNRPGVVVRTRAGYLAPR